MSSALPVERKKPVRVSPQLSPYVAWIENILETDKQAPRKQRHTAHRIWTRLMAEFPDAKLGESTLRHFVGERKRELRLPACP